MVLVFHSLLLVSYALSDRRWDSLPCALQLLRPSRTLLVTLTVAECIHRVVCCCVEAHGVVLPGRIVVCHQLGDGDASLHTLEPFGAQS